MLIRNRMYLVSRGITEVTPIYVPPYEALILQLVHGEGEVVEVPDAEARKKYNVAFLPEDQAWLNEARTPDADWLASLRSSLADGDPRKHASDEDLLKAKRAAPFVVLAPVNLDAHNEHARLSTRYGKHFTRDMTFCEFAFGLPHENRLARAMSEVAFHVAGVKQTPPADEETDPPPLIDAGEDDANPDDVDTMPLAELRKSLEALGVAFAANEPTANLRAKLKKALGLAEAA